VSNYMPYQNTTISERKSMLQVQELLEGAGFDQVATVCEKKSGRRAVIAMYGGAEFRFEIDTVAMREKISKRVRIDVMKVGWRLMWAQVKETCDGIKWGVITPAQAFSGYLCLPDGRTVANQVTEAIENGSIKSGFNLLQIEGPQ